MGTHPIFESDFDCLTDMKILEPEWAIPLPEKALDGCIDDENIFILGEKSVFVYDKKSRSRCATYGVKFGSGAALGILKSIFLNTSTQITQMTSKQFFLNSGKILAYLWI